MAIPKQELNLKTMKPNQVEAVRNVLKQHEVEFELKYEDKSTMAPHKFTLILDRNNFYRLFDLLMLMLTQFEIQQKEIEALEGEKSSWKNRCYDMIATDFMVDDVTPYRNNLEAEDHIDNITDELIFRGVEYNIIGDKIQLEWESAEKVLHFCWTIIHQYYDNDQRIGAAICNHG